jgi:hypothetical protein
MVNYQIGKIYKIVCNITDECYIGSTCEPTLAMRLSKHVACYKRWKSGNCGKVTCYDIIDRGDYKILLIECFPCNNKDELNSREGHVTREYKKNSDIVCINKRIESRTKREYYLDNKIKIDERNKRYYKDNFEKNKDKSHTYYMTNKDKINKYASKKITCECGSCFRISDKARHERSQKHQVYLKLRQ